VLTWIVVLQVLGNVSLSRGMRLVGRVSLASPATLMAGGIHALTNPWILLGIAFLIAYFLCYLAALSRLELSYVLPMTSSNYVLTALLASWTLGETLSATRWLGTCMICGGILLVGLSQRKKVG